MQSRQWLNQSQPQTFQIAVFLLYARAAIVLLFGLDLQFAVLPVTDLFRVLMPVAGAAAGFGIANDKRWGYVTGLVVAILPILTRLLLGVGVSLGGDDLPSINPFDYDVIGLLFDIALLVALVHPHSREYQRIWFR